MLGFYFSMEAAVENGKILISARNGLFIMFILQIFSIIEVTLKIDSVSITDTYTYFSKFSNEVNLCSEGFIR